MGYRLFSISALCLGAAGLLTAAPARGADSKLAVLPTQFDKSAEGQVPAEIFDETVMAAVQALGGLEVIGQDDINALVGFEKQREMLSCEDASCFADIGGALGVDRLAVLKIALLGTGWVVTGKVINIRETRVESRMSEIIEGSPTVLMKSVPMVVGKLFGTGHTAAVQPLGPQPLPPQGVTSPSAQSRPAGPTARVMVTADPGWARGGGIFGLIAGGGVLVLALAAEATKGETSPSLPLGAAATVLFGAGAPITYKGGKSARRSPGVDGVIGLRVVGWISYGVGMGAAAILLLYGTLDFTPPDGWITVAGGLGALSCGMLAIDALVASSEARGLRQAQQAAAGVAPGPFVTPALSAVRRHDGSVMPVPGVALVF